MKKILLTTICMAFATFSFSQQLSRYVVSSGGNYSNAGGYSNSSTIGESMVTTLTSASNVLTQGFQQSFSNSVDPTITIINPLDGDVFPNNNNIGIDFAITDFVVAAGTGDGHIHYYVNGAMTMKYDTLPITLNGLANGSHQIIIELVDNSHQGFSPTIADTVNFIVNVISGCTDSTALNYDPTATIDDSSCTYCTGTFANIDVGGGSWLSEVSWTLLNSSGGIVLSGGAPFSLDTCLADDCYTVDMVDSYGDGWNGSTFNLDGVALGGLLSGYAGSFTFTTGSASCAITGCTDMLATNYDPTATVDDGSCTYPCLDNVVVFNGYDSWGDGWNGGTYDVTSNGASVASGGMTSGSSFTDTLCLPTGCYDVTVGGGFYDNEISFDFASLVGSAAGTYTDISVGGAICGVVVVNGCTDSTALNYDPTATVDDGSCVYCVYGCTDSTAVNYAALATCDDGTCIASVYGCTDATACNYYAGATVDDGSCDYSCNTTCGASPITGLGVTNVIHDRVTLTFDDMNTYDASGAQLCRVDQLRIKYREVGTSSWSQKNMAAPTGYDPTTGICNSTQNTDKLVLGLTGSTTYEWEMRVWYCATGATAWVLGPNFTTAW